MAGLHSDASGSTVLRYAYTLRPTQWHRISHLHMHMPSDQISHRRVALTQSSLCPGNCYLTCRAVRVPAVVADDQFARHGCAAYPDVRMIPRQPSPRMAVYSDLTGTGGAQLLNHGVSTELIPISILRVSVWGGGLAYPLVSALALYHRDVGRSVSPSAGVYRLRRDSRRRRGGSTSDRVRNSRGLAIYFGYFHFAR